MLQRRKINNKEKNESNWMVINLIVCNLNSRSLDKIFHLRLNISAFNNSWRSWRIDLFNTATTIKRISWIDLSSMKKIKDFSAISPFKLTIKSYQRKLLSSLFKQIKLSWPMKLNHIYWMRISKWILKSRRSRLSNRFKPLLKHI